MKILLFREHKGDPLSAAISALTRGQYVHAAVLTDDRNALIHEAYYPAVRIRLLSIDELPGVDVFSVPRLTASEEAQVLTYLNQHVGDQYCVLDLFRFLPFVREFFGEDNEKAAAQHCFCSMYAFDALQFGGVNLLSRINGWRVSPNTLSYSPYLIQVPALTGGSFTGQQPVP